MSRLILIAGPCVIESYDICCEIAEKCIELAKKYQVDYIFKASFDKANRSSSNSFRSKGFEYGLDILAQIKKKYGTLITTDVHETYQVESVAKVVDIIQIPAFLCRQTDLIKASVSTGKVVNIKKGQFISPSEIPDIISKARGFGSQNLIVTERGTTFGYNNLVVDMRTIHLMKDMGVTIFFDATHSVQYPGKGGDRTMAPVLARAALAAGADGLFCEVHPNPDKALSDGPNSLDFELLEQVIREGTIIHSLLS